MYRIIRASKYDVGDYVEYDWNWRGVNPKVTTGTIRKIEPGLAGHGDTRPDPIYTLEDDNGKCTKIGEGAILGLA